MTAIGEAYATLAKLKRRLGIADSNTAKDDELQDRLDSASDDINNWCGRQFGQTDTATTRTYPLCAGGVETDDFWTDDDLAVVPYLGTSAGTAWTVASVELHPLNGIRNGSPGWPYDRIAYLSPLAGHPLAMTAYRARVTAKWGWASVPRPVETACLLIAAMDNKAGDAPFGIAAFGDYAARIRANPMAEEKLRPYVKDLARVAT